MPTPKLRVSGYSALIYLLALLDSASFPANLLLLIPLFTIH